MVMSGTDGVVKRGYAFIVGHAGIFHLQSKNQDGITELFMLLCYKKSICISVSFQSFNLQVKVRVKVLKSGELNSFSSVSELLSRSVLHPRGETPSACFRAGRERFLEVLPILSGEQRRAASG